MPRRTMETLVLDAAAPEAIERAAALLDAGDLVALPTETVYGLAADAARPEALAAVFQAKERPLFDPLIVHLPDRGWLDRLTEPSKGQVALLQRLTAAFWPGPLTVVLPRRMEAVHDLITAGGPFVAVRMSAHPVFRAVVELLGRPLAAPSANRFGRISPTTGAHVFAELNGRIPLILEAGPTPHGLESTVIVPSADGERLRMLRHGPITAETLAGFAEVEAWGATSRSEQSAAPGQTPGHYAPGTPLTLLAPSLGAISKANRRIGFLGLRADQPVYPGTFESSEYLSEHGDLTEAATRLFAALRRLDEAGLDRIYAEPVPDEGLGRAIMDRLRRAAAGSGPIGVPPGHPAGQGQA